MEIEKNNLHNSQQWLSMQLLSGSVKSYFDPPNNRISTNSYSMNETLAVLIFRSLARFQSVTLIATIITQIALPQVTPFYMTLYATELVIFLLVFIITQIVLDQEKRVSDASINSRKCKVYRGENQYPQMSWSDIQQGDILYLTQGQVAPADLLLLDSQEIEHRQAITFVDTKNLNGSVVSEKKKACYLTQMLNRGMMQKRNWEHYRKILTGHINYEKNNKDLNNFQGYLKLSKDPKVQKLKIENIILRESSINTSLWIYGVVLYTGMNCKIMLNVKQQTSKSNIYIRKFNIFFLICIILNLVCGTIFGFIYMFSKPERQSFGIATYHYLMFSTILPHMCYVAINLFLLTFKLTKQFSKILIRNYNALFSLGHVDFAILSNTGVTTSGQVLIDKITTTSSIYQIHNQLDKKLGPKKSRLLLDQRRKGSSLAFNNSSGNKLPFAAISPMGLTFEEQQNQDDYKFQIDDTQGRLAIPQNHLANNTLPKINTKLQPLKINKSRMHNSVKRQQNQSVQIMKAFVLCHQARLFYHHQKNEYIGVSSVKEEEVLLQLANSIGWQVEPKLDRIKEIGLIVKIQRQKMLQNGLLKFENDAASYEWVGINYFETQRKLFSVVVSTNNRHFMYCKGRPQQLLPRLKFDTSRETTKLIQQQIDNYKNNGSNAILFAKKQLSFQEKEIYENEYTSLKFSLTRTPQQIEQFSKKFENHLEFVCIVGFQTQVNPKAQELINFIQDSNIKPIMLGRDRADINCYKSIFDKKDQIQYVYLEKNTSQLIRYYLNYITTQFKNEKKKKFVLIINGQSWRIIKNNTYVLDHFLFALYYSQGLFIFQFDNQLAKELTNCLKNNYPRQHTVLGVGYSYCDLKFLDQSDIGIGIYNDLPTDIKVQSLDKVATLLQIGPYLLEALSSIINISIYRVILLFTVITTYEIFLISNNSSFTMNTDLVFIYLVIHTLLEIIYTIFVNNQVEKLAKPALYGNFRHINRRVYLTICQAIIHGIVIVVGTVLVLPDVRLRGGALLPIQSVHLSIFILLFLISNFRNYFNSKYSKLALTFFTICSFIIITICIVITAVIKDYFAKIALQIVNLITNYDSATMLLNITVFNMAFSLFIYQVVHKYIFTELKEIDLGENNNIANETIKQSIEPEYNHVELVNYLFNEQENIDSSIISLVQEQIDVKSFKIDRSFEIRNRQANIKYLYQNSYRSILIFRRVILLTFALSLVLLMITVIEEPIAFKMPLIPLIILIALLSSLLIYIFIKSESIMMTYYNIVNITIPIVGVLLVLYSILHRQQSQYLRFMLYAMICTQYIEVKFYLLVILLTFLWVANIISLLYSTLNPNQHNRENQLTISSQAIEILIVFILNLFLLARSIIDKKTSFIVNQEFQKQTNHVNDVLSILVPKFVKNHLEKNLDNKALQQEQKKVGILFCYVCQFDQMVKQEGKNVVVLMDQLFRQFDQLCHNFAVQKIQTVGMTYMAATGIKDYQDQLDNQMKKKNEVQRLLKMGIQMIQKSKNLSWGEHKNKRIKIKIGIHAGPVIIGVIGYHKPQFSLIGDTVNTTSRHCSTAQAGQIVLSKIAYESIKRFPTSSFQKSMKYMKGLDTVPVYRYLKNQTSESRHIQIKLKFIAIVRKVIQKLKQQGKIKYKKFKASDFAANIMIQRQSGKKITYATQQRRSSKRSSIFLIDQHLQQINQAKESKNQFTLKHNIVLELTKSYPQYKNYIIKKFNKTDKALTGILIFINLCQLFLTIQQDTYSVGSIAFRLCAIALQGLTILSYRLAIKSNLVVWLFVLICAIDNCAVAFNHIISSKQSTLHNFYPFYAMVSLTIIASLSAYRFIHVLALTIIFLLVSIVYFTLKLQFDQAIVYEFFYFIFILIRKYHTISDQYHNYSQLINDQKKTQQQSALVSQLLPKHAYEKLKNQDIENRLQLTDKFQNATMLFADIKGYTAFSNRNTPIQVVKMLRGLFEQFDKSCLKYNVYKVYTIGDCYVVLGFTDCYQRNVLQQTKNVLDMGFAMVDIINKVKQRLDFPELDMRIGIHTGTIIGGIIGTEIVRYDIYGSDVMIANKFQQNGIIGKIHISQSTKAILDQDKNKTYNITPNGKVKVEKLNAQFNGYIVTRKKFELL